MAPTALRRIGTPPHLLDPADFRAHLRDALARSGADDRPIVLVLIAPDRISALSAALGPSAADEVLAAVADRVRSVVPRDAVVGSLDRRTLGVAHETVDGGPPEELIAALVAALEGWHELQGARVTAAGRFGIASGTPDAADVDTLLRNAELALRQAQLSPPAAVFEPQMHVAAVARLQLEADLGRALERSEFSLEYQPIVALGGPRGQDAGSRIVAVEALLRWRHPARGIVSPAEFLPLAEETGQIVEIGGWVLREGCRQLRAWQMQHSRHRSLAVALNLSARQLLQPGFVAMLSAAVTTADVDPSSVIVELTESAVMTEVPAAVAVLHDLRGRGIRIGLDDFGTGRSSLSQLAQLPVDVLKIDRAFVARLSVAPAESAIARALVDIGTALGHELVAEGVETRSQLLELQQLGVALGQGFYFSKPLGPAGVGALLRSDRGR